MCIRYERKNTLADTLDVLAGGLFVAGILFVLVQVFEPAVLWVICLFCLWLLAVYGLLKLAHSLRNRRWYY